MRYFAADQVVPPFVLCSKSIESSPWDEPDSLSCQAMYRFPE